jgi:hypothetical protein
MSGNDSGDGDMTGARQASGTGGVRGGTQEYLQQLAKENPSAYEAPLAVAVKWLGRVATTVGWEGSSKENLKVALCYHLIVNGSSPDVKLETPLAVPGTAGVHTHKVLVSNLGSYTLRQMAATILTDKVSDCLELDNVKDALRPRAARAGLDAQHMRLAVDFLPPSAMTPTEMLIREAGRMRLIDRRGQSKRNDLKSVGERSEQVIPDSGGGPVGDMSWS